MTYMLSKNLHTIAAEWNRYKGYTVRPLPSTISYYQQKISNQTKDHNEEKILMYGGTPEIRSIFQLMQLNSTLVDRSEDMIKAMGLLTHNQTMVNANETIFTCDWLDLNFADNSFDILIGDDAINMVAWHQFPNFLQSANRILKPDGIFICHLLVKPSLRYIQNSFMDIVHEYSQQIIKSKYDLASRLNFHCYDLNNYAMGWQQTINSLGAEKLNYFVPELDFISTFKCCNSTFYCPPIMQFESLVEKYFTIVEIFYPHEHDYCQFEPVYLLRKI